MKIDLRNRIRRITNFLTAFLKKLWVFARKPLFQRSKNREVSEIGASPGRIVPVGSFKETARALLRLHYKKLIAGSLGLAVLLGVVDFFTTTRLLDISSTQELEARGGVIRMRYSRPPRAHGNYLNGPDAPTIVVDYIDDGKTEIVKLQRPTPYNQSLTLTRGDDREEYLLFGLFRPKKTIPIKTGMQQVAIAELIPAENTRPAPETMENQLVIRFTGEVRGKYRTGVNILPSEMEYVHLLTPHQGYYRWSNDETLTFNFTEEPPKHETTYGFEVFPETFIDKSFQVWSGKTAEAKVTTSTNEVYVSNFNLKGDVEWRDTLRIEFSGPMVGALDVLKEKPQAKIPVEINPAAGGVWVWANARTLEFRPDDKTGWPVKKNVTVRVLPSINTEAGRKWRGGPKAFEASFHILPRRQSITNFSLRGEGVSLEEDLIVDFSRELTAEKELRRFFANNPIADNIPFIFEPKVNGKFYWTRAEKLKFRPDNLWSELTEYTVKLNPKFNPDPRFEWEGTKEFKFKTVENLVTAQIYFTPEIPIAPADFFANPSPYASLEVDPEQRLWILFDKPFGRHLPAGTKLEEAVSITPAVNVNFKWIAPNLLEVNPPRHWAEKKDFKIKLTKKLFFHPQQHFAKEADTFKFKTKANLVTVEAPASFDPAGPVTFTFSKNMNQLVSVGRAYRAAEIEAKHLPFTITPSLDWSFVWDNPRKLNVTAKKYWTPTTKYKFRLNPSLLPAPEAKFSKTNDVGLESAENIVGLARFSPDGVVDRHVKLEAEFTKSIIPPGATHGSELKEALFKIEPPVTGKWIWLSDNRLGLTVTEPLLPSTEYTVTLDPNQIVDKQLTWEIATDKKTGRFPIHESQFNTPAVHVVNTGARFDFDPKNLLKQKFYLDMEISEPVLEKDLRKHFSIWFMKGNVEKPLVYKIQVGGVTPEGAIREFSVVSDWIDRPADDRKIQYKITEGLAPTVGNLSLAEDYEADFLQEKPKHIRITNVGFKYEDRKFKGLLSLTSPVEPDKLAEGLTLTLKGKKDPVKFTVRVAPQGPDGNPRRSRRVSSYGEGEGEESSGEGSESGEEPVAETESSESDEDTYVSNQKFAYEIQADFRPSSKYTFRLREGLLATDGAFTPKATSRNGAVPGLNQELGFELAGSILSRQDIEKVPVLSVNHHSFNISVRQIYPNNVRYFLNNELDSHQIDNVAKTIFQKQYQVAPKRGLASAKKAGKPVVQVKDNPIVTHVDLTKLFQKNKKGMFQICVGSDGCSSSRWFLSTDIGLIARRFGKNVVVWASSLSNAKPLGGVNVEVVDTWNQSIATATTGGDGFATLTLPAGAAPTQILGAKNEDFSFINLNRHHDKLWGYDITGVSSEKASLRSFIYSDRGVYRPGDTVHLVSVTRGRNGTSPTDVPVNFELTSPLGKAVLSERFRLEEHGLYVHDFVVPAESQTGKWNATVAWHSPTGKKESGNYTFQVEEFVPNKIKVELELLSKRARPGESLRFKVVGKNLFGPPASGNRVNGEVKLRAHFFKPKGFEKYVFGHEDVEFQRIDHTLKEDKLDVNGNFVYEYAIPEGIRSPIGLRAHYTATVLDDGGRGVAAYGETDVYLHGQYVGVQKLTPGEAALGQPVSFEVVNVLWDGRTIARKDQKLNLKLYHQREVTHYRKNERGYYRYVTEKERVLVKDYGNPLDDEGKIQITPALGGQHILEVTDLASQHMTRKEFYVQGDPGLAGVLEADKIQLKLLTTGLEVGGEAKIEVRTPFPGHLLILGEQKDVLFSRSIELQDKHDIITIPITEKFAPNFYVTAALIRPVKKGNRNSPVYATGLLEVRVKNREHAPELTLTAPAQVSAHGELEVKIKVSDLNKSRMHFTLAAVDEGILDLTGFKTPPIEGYFDEKRALEVTHYAMHQMIMPYEPEVKREIFPGGDAPSRALIKKSRVNPHSQNRVKSLALWSGVLELDAKGEATHKFKIPDFEGTVRVMAVTFGKQRFASAEKSVLIRDKIIARPNLPRFLATGDQFVVPIMFHNGTNEDLKFEYRINVSDHFQLQGDAQKVIELPKGQKTLASVGVQVTKERGLAYFELIAQDQNNRTRKYIEIPVRAPGNSVTLAGAGVVDKISPKTIEIPRDFLSGTEEYAMVVTAHPMVRFQNGLNYLLRYPHGCLEQTVSKAFPLLFFGDLARAAGQRVVNDPARLIKDGIEKIERSQLEDGSYAYWEGTSNYNSWSFVYASHFLVEAQKQGHAIGEASWNNMLAKLQKMTEESLTKGSLYKENNVSDHLYALYVLALAGESVGPKVNHVYDEYFEELKPHDRARLAAALHLTGSQETATEILAKLGDMNLYAEPYRYTGGNFSSDARDLAILLDSVVQVDAKSELITPLVDKLTSRTAYGRWGTTQENAFAYLALGKAYATADKLQTKGKIVIGGKTTIPVDKQITLNTSQLAAGNVRLTVEGNGNLNYAWEAVGVARKLAALQDDHGIRVRRRLLGRDGKPAKMDSIKQGDLVVAEITVESLKGALSNVVVTDLLPAGLEVENARLSTASVLAWIKQDITPDQVDIRDDRINVYTSVPGSKAKYFYTARAVTAGTFSMPGIRAEAMYNPEIYSESDSGTLRVVAKK